MIAARKGDLTVTEGDQTSTVQEGEQSTHSRRKRGGAVPAASGAPISGKTVGIIAGAAVIPPVLNLLAEAYGFAGAPHISAISAKPLPAPQASLISSLALGVIGKKLDWNMIGLGAAIGAVIAAVDALLGARKSFRLPPLAVGMGPRIAEREHERIGTVAKGQVHHTPVD